MKRIRLFLINIGVRTRTYPLVAPPMGLISIAAHVRAKLPVDIMVVNQRVDNLTADELVRRAVDFDADVVGFSSFTTAAHALPLLAQKTRAALPDALILVGGPHASGVRGRVLEETCADVVVPGEGEVAAEMILRAWAEGGRDFGGIPGIVWRDSAGELVQNPGVPPLVENLDDIPMPAYDLIDLPRYWKMQSIAPVYRRRYASLVTSRGCPYHCIWCHKIFGKSIRMLSPERVVDELEHLQKTYGICDFEFLDDNFNFKPKRVLQICDMLKQRGVKTRMAFPNGLRADLLNTEVIDAMVDAGTYQCSLALETGSPRLQKFTCKVMNIPKLLECAEYITAKRVYTNLFCMMGFPTETEEEIKTTIDVACKSPFHTVAFYTVTPFPGTTLYDIVQRDHPEKIANIRYDDMDISGMRVNLTDLPDETLFYYQRLALRRFYMNPRRIARLIRCHPQAWMLPAFTPIFLYRATKGMLPSRGKSTDC